MSDRLVKEEERQWVDDKLRSLLHHHLPFTSTAPRPLLFSDWLTHDYQPVKREDVREFVQSHLGRFQEEEVDVPLVLFSEVLDHMLRIDRVLKEPQGHALLIGQSGCGKSLLARFVAWLNGHAILSIKVNAAYSAKEFDEDLKTVLRFTLFLGLVLQFCQTIWE